MRSREGANDKQSTIRLNESEEEWQGRMELYVFLGCKPEGSRGNIQGSNLFSKSIHGL